jgi:hypothetical protein
LPGQPVTTTSPAAFGGPCGDWFCHPLRPTVQHIDRGQPDRANGKTVSIQVLCSSTDASGKETSGPSCVKSRPSDSVRMIASLEWKTPQNAEREIETGIPFEVDSRTSNGKRAFHQPPENSGTASGFVTGLWQNRGRLKPLGFRDIKRRLEFAGFEEISQTRKSRKVCSRIVRGHGYSNCAATARSACRNTPQYPQPGSNRTGLLGQVVNRRDRYRQTPLRAPIRAKLRFLNLHS